MVKMEIIERATKKVTFSTEDRAYVFETLASFYHKKLIYKVSTRLKRVQYYTHQTISFYAPKYVTVFTVDAHF